jgi:hypothetical protein
MSFSMFILYCMNCVAVNCLVVRILHHAVFSIVSTMHIFLVGPPGIEPGPNGLKVRCATSTPQSHILVGR